MSWENNQQFIVDDSGKFWGRYGAAGVLLRCPDARHKPLVLLQHRALFGHFGGTWGLPGGALNADETAVTGALRELHEETGIEPTQLNVVTSTITFTSASGWTYTTVLAEATTELTLYADHESLELRWVPEDDVFSYELHPELYKTWPQFRVQYHSIATPRQQRLTIHNEHYLWNTYPEAL